MAGLGPRQLEASCSWAQISAWPLFCCVDLGQVPGLTCTSSLRGREGGGELFRVSPTAEVLEMLGLRASTRRQARWLRAQPVSCQEAASLRPSVLLLPPLCLPGSRSLMEPLGRQWEGPRRPPRRGRRKTPVIWHRDGLLFTKTHGPGHPSGTTREPFIQPQVSFLWQSGAHGTISQPPCVWNGSELMFSGVHLTRRRVGRRDTWAPQGASQPV